MYTHISYILLISNNEKKVKQNTNQKKLISLA